MGGLRGGASTCASVVSAGGSACDGGAHLAGVCATGLLGVQMGAAGAGGGTGAAGGEGGRMGLGATRGAAGTLGGLKGYEIHVHVERKTKIDIYTYEESRFKVCSCWFALIAIQNWNSKLFKVNPNYAKDILHSLTAI